MSHLKILLAEDDRNLGMILKAFLDANGHATTLCANGEDAWKTFGVQHFDLCLFDITMPVMDGFTLARKVKEVQSDIPIIFLTAHDELEDILEGFAIGADDYVTKPFNMEELLARINAVCRRYAVSPSTPMEFRLGSFIFDAPRHTLTDSQGEERKLTSKESDLLLMLCESKGNTLERSHALQTIWKEENRTNARSMDVYITKLRKYFSEDPDVSITNVHGVGFRLDVK
jgi:DNA-binding response OmpR family regulator